MRRNYHFSLLKVCALCFAVQFSLQVPCACKAILMVFDNEGTHSACAPCARNQHPVRLITQVHTLQGATCAIQHVPARLITQVHTLRSATCAMDVVPTCLIMQVHALRSATCAMDVVPTRLIMQAHALRSATCAMAFDNAGSRSACATCAMDVVPWTQRPLESRIVVEA